MIGTTISHYKIVEKLGEGGMGVVYKAEDTKLHRSVALKFLPPHIVAKEVDRTRFLQEAQSAAVLNHPNICTIYGIHDEGERPFIEMEFVDGKTLRELDLVNSKPGTSLGYAVQIGEALQEAHSRGIVHRDIKADNIMVNAKGQVKVMDFGLAKIKGALKITKSSSTLGTLGYMAPEQIQGGLVDARSDIFALGVVLFEMLTDHLPFRGDHEPAMMYSILSEPPELLAKYRSDLPEDLQRILSRSLEKEPEDRYQSAADMVSELRRLQKKTTNVHRTAALTTMPATQESTPARISEPVTTGSVSPGPSSLKKFLWPTVGILVALGAILAYKYLLTPSSTQQFQQMKITRLTNSGRVKQAAVSPDGRYIVYAQEDAGKQSLWVRQTATTSNVQVVPPSDAQYYQILFSKDGNFVYLAKAEKEGDLSPLYSMPVLGGPMRKLIENINSFTLSPDGTHVGFIRYTIGNATFELIIANADGTGEHTLGQRKAPESYDALAWSPDGKSITCALVDVNNVSVVSIPVDGGQSKLISKCDWSTIFSMEWLQDGSGIVVIPQDRNSASSAQIWEIAYPSGELRRITNDLNNYASISLTADSKSLVTTEVESHSTVWKLPAFEAGRIGWNAERAKQLTSGKDDGSGGVAQAPDGRIVFDASSSGTPQIWIMESDGSNARQLTSGDTPSANPTISPDGKYILCLREPKGSIDIWRMNLDGSNPLQLTHGDFSFTPSCTPDSRWVFYTHVGGGKYFLWKVPIDGGNPVQVTDKHSHTVTVSRDGKFLACEYQENEAGTSHQVAIIPLEGGKPVKTFERKEYARFEWLPDGRSLAVLDTRGGVSNVWTLPLDGSKDQPLTNFKSDKIFEFSWSSDGKSLIVSRGPVVSDVIMVNNFH